MFPAQIMWTNLGYSPGIMGMTFNVFLLVSCFFAFGGAIRLLDSQGDQDDARLS